MKHPSSSQPPSQPATQRIYPTRSPTKLKRHRRRRRRAAAVFTATFLVAAMLVTATLQAYRPALLLDTGRFIWGIKSSVIELSFAIIAARLPKHH